MKLKICGLRHTENIQSLLSLQPDYLGFIFYEKSKRYAEGTLDVSFIKSQKFSEFNSTAPTKTGVFVNEDLNKIKAIVDKYELNAVQLHGDETEEFCGKLQDAFHPPAPLKGGRQSAKTKSQNLERKNPIASKRTEAINIARSNQQARTMSPLEGGRGVNHEIQIIKVFSVDNTFDFSKTKKYESVCDYFLFDTKGKERGGNGIAFNWELLNKYHGKKLFFLSGGIGPEDASEIKKINHPKLYGVDINSRFESEPGLKDVEAVEKFVNEIRK